MLPQPPAGVCYLFAMSEWAQREFATDKEGQKHLRADALEALDPAKQAAAGQSAELAEDVAPEEAAEHGERTVRERAQGGLFDLLSEEEEAQEQAAAPPSGQAGPATTTERAPPEKDSGIQHLTEVRPPEVEAIASRAGRGSAAAELLGAEARVGRGGARQIEAMVAAAFEPAGRPLAFTARRRRRLTDVEDPELDALLDAVREIYPAAPVVAPDPALAAWAEEGGVAFDEPPPRGVLGP